MIRIFMNTSVQHAETLHDWQPVIGHRIPSQIDAMIVEYVGGERERWIDRYTHENFGRTEAGRL